MPEQDINVTDEIFEWARRIPYAPALIGGNQVIHYRTLCVAVMRAMAAFREAGWAPDSLVAISLEGNVALQLVVSLALARAGLAQVWLAPGDPVEYRVARARALGVRVVITDQAHGQLQAIAQFVPDPAWLSAPGAVPADLRVCGTGKAMITIQSSGTTGAPKDIIVTQEHQLRLEQKNKAVSACLPGERYLFLAGLRFWTGLTRSWRCLSNGGAIVVPPANWSAEDLLRCIEVHHVTYLWCIPLHVHMLLKAIGDEVHRLPGLRFFRCSSAALPVPLVQEARLRISPMLSILYGTNETGAIAVAQPELVAKHPDCVGFPLEGVELEIVDEDDRPLAAGAIGQVRVRGAGVASRLSREVSPQGSSGYQGDWYYPGDVGLRNEEGVLFLKGRRDDVMNFDGIMVGPTELEAVLCRHPAVVDAAAFALPSAIHQDIPAAALILKHPVSNEELSVYCRQHLGVRAPRMFFVIDVIPRNPMGKILRRRLSELAVAQMDAGSARTGE